MCEGNVAGIPALKLMFQEGKKLLEVLYSLYNLYYCVYRGRGIEIERYISKYGQIVSNFPLFLLKL